MPRPARRTRSRKRINKALPGGRQGTHYKSEGASYAVCRLCSKPLAGIPQLSLSKIRKFNRTKRRIQRMYGGQLCHNCLRTALKQAARTISLA
ncbi:50S ribosomal protein L34e [Candidatus Bathyarchaeota archaeon]|nr:50S ribosomal protein L34e [Candidatus Bathyarchaeota archaeon]